jgi:GTP-binding protein
MFADKVEIKVKAGRGGDGRLGFRHEKYRAKGGPDGGDGGRGGSVVFRVTHNLNTLAAFRRGARIAAEAGEAGGGDRRHGRNGEDVVVPVPEGTQVFDDGVLVADLVQDGQEAVIAKGGRGGFGNAHFTSSVRQAPRAIELGEPGQERTLTLELKLVADVGLVGLPNAGKSTLLSVISNAKPEIGDYPFTTLTPNLGVVDFEGNGFLVADIPGLIEGASTGKGLGDEFLRHIERTAVLIHLIDAYSDDVARDYRLIHNELGQYSEALLAKPQLVALTKIEGMDAAELAAKTKTLQKAAGKKVQIYAISAAAHLHIDALLHDVLPLVLVARAERASAASEAAIPVIDEATQPELWRIEKSGHTYTIYGEKLEGFGRRTDWSNDASVERLRDILRKEGVVKQLTREGIAEGDVVRLGDKDLPWFD